MQGRAQVVADPVASPLVPGSCTPRPLVFYLDGAHSPESMEMCAKWFSSIIREEDPQEESPGEGRLDDHGSAQQVTDGSLFFFYLFFLCVCLWIM